MRPIICQNYQHIFNHSVMISIIGASVDKENIDRQRTFHMYVLGRMLLTNYHNDV